MSDHYHYHVPAGRRCFILHAWKVVEDNGKSVYRQCERCGAREVFQRPGGHQPIDKHWVETGEWTPRPTPPNIGRQPRKL